MANDNVVVGRGSRPLSVWVLCIADGLLAVFLIATSIVAEDRGFAGGQAAIAGISGLGISIAAHATWFGKRTGRLVLLLLLTMFLGLIIAHSGWIIVLGLQYGYFAGPVPAAFIRAGLSLLWLALNYSILFGRKAKVFFR